MYTRMAGSCIKPIERTGRRRFRASPCWQEEKTRSPSMRSTRTPANRHWFRTSTPAACDRGHLLSIHPPVSWLPPTRSPTSCATVTSSGACPPASRCSASAPTGNLISSATTTSRQARPEACSGWASSRFADVRLPFISQEVIHPQNVQRDPALHEAVPLAVLRHLDVRLHL